MKTLKRQVEEIINRPHYGHPSREDEIRIDKLESIVLRLAQQIDNMNQYSL